MDRRDFLAKFSTTAAAAGAGATTVAAVAYPKVRQGVDSGWARISGDIKALNRRIDDMDESQRRMFKILLVAVSLSTGFDALRLLNGDLL